MRKLLLTTAALIGLTTAVYANDEVTISPQGAIQIDYGHFLNNSALDSGIDFRRVRLGIKGVIHSMFNYSTELEVSDGTAHLNTAWLSYKPEDLPVKFVVGKFVQPLGMARSTSGKNLAFLERPLVSDIAIDTLAGAKRYGVGMYTMINNFWLGSSISANKETDTEDVTSLNGRLVWHDIKETGVLHLGLNLSKTFEIDQGFARWRSYPEIRTDGNKLLDSGTNKDIDSSYVVGVEGAISHGSLWASSEYFLFGDNHNDYEGFYVDVGYVLTGEGRDYSLNKATWEGITPISDKGAAELVARFSTVDIDTEKETNYTVGLNWYFNKYVKLQTNLMRADFNKQEDFTSVGVRVAVRF